MNLIINHIQFFVFAFTISIISAIQPGLVNLSVAYASANGNNLEAKLITRGATVIEVIYALGIGFGKILILFFYQVIGVKILQNISIIKRNINKTIGLLLIGSAIIQILNIQ